MSRPARRTGSALVAALRIAGDAIFRFFVESGLVVGVMVWPDDVDRSGLLRRQCPATSLIDEIEAFLRAHDASGETPGDSGH